MKFSTVAAVAASATLASAQLSALPQCAISCATGPLVGTGCPLTDFACICKATSFINGLVGCVEKSCTPAEVAQAGKAATNLCADAGVVITIPGQGGEQSSAAPAPAPSTEAPAPAPSTEAPAPSSEAPAPAPSSEAPVASSAYTSAAPVESSAASSSPCPSTSTVVAVTTLTTSCTTKSTVPAPPVYSAPPVYTTPAVVPSPNATVPVPTAPAVTAPAPPVYTGAAAMTKVGGLSAVVVAMVAGLLL